MTLTSRVVCDRCLTESPPTRSIEPIRKGFSRLDFSTAVMLDGVAHDESRHLCESCLASFNEWLLSGRPDSGGE